MLTDGPRPGVGTQASPFCGLGGGYVTLIILECMAGLVQAGIRGVKHRHFPAVKNSRLSFCLWPLKEKALEQRRVSVAGPALLPLQLES